MGEQTETNHDAGAAMDYPEHEKTFNLFLALTKWGTVATAALLIAMAFGFFAARRPVRRHHRFRPADDRFAVRALTRNVAGRIDIARVRSS
ncbi:MAG: aa3-type cytochrome c oxidase subunit IV [Hyphomicrobiales bacterium]